MNDMSGKDLKQQAFDLLQNSNEEWRKAVLELAKVFCAQYKGKRMRSEQFRRWIERNYSEVIPVPSSNNVWGTIPRSMTKMGLIEFTGEHACPKDPKSHARPVRVYRIL